MESNLADQLNFAILTHCMFSILYLSAYQWERNKWLVLGIATLFLLQMGIYFTVDHLSLWERLLMGNPAFVLFMMPCLYLFARKQVLLLVSRKEVLLHFLPGMLFYFLFLFTEVSHPRTFISKMSQGEILPVHFAHLVVFMITLAYYSYAILQLIRYNQQKYQEEYADATIFITLDWLKYSIWLIAFAGTIGSLAVLSPSTIVEKTFIPFEIIELSFLLSVMGLSYFSFRQPVLYQTTEETSLAKGLGGVEDKPMAARPLLSAQKVEELSQQIDTYFREKKPFLELDVRMPDIAKALDIKPNEFSWYLNEHHQKNFFTFINQYRVDYAVDLLKNEAYEHYTIEAISKMSGFRSKTTFNSRFKEIMNLTPSAFRKTIN